MCAQRLKTDAELRDAVERRLRCRLYEAVWADLLELREEYLEERIEDEREAFGLLVEEAERRIRLVEGVRAELESQGREGYAPPSPLPFQPRNRSREGEPAKRKDPVAEVLSYFYHISDESRNMLLAITEYFGHLANRHPEVQRFRESILPDGKLLDEEQAIGLLSSYAARFLSLEEMQRLGIPIVGHTASIQGVYEEHGRGGTVDHRVTVEVRPPGATLRLRYAGPDAGPFEGYLTRYKAGSGTTLPPYNVPLQTKLLDESKRTIESMNLGVEGAAESGQQGVRIGPVLFGHLNTEREPTEVWPGSLVDEIYAFSERLAATFRWPSRAARARPFGMLDSRDASAMFLLTGRNPTVRPVEVKVRDWRGGGSTVRGVVLDIAPWVRKEDVAGAYAMAQRTFVGRRNRWPSEKTLRVVRFVLQRRRRSPRDDNPTWPALLEAWNREHPDEKFRDYRSLRTYFERGRDAIEKLHF